MGASPATGGIVAAKRFTDTGKWDKAWFRKLSPVMKCAWSFLCDRCDHAGIWDIDEAALEFFIGQPLSIDEMAHAFGDRFSRIASDKIIIEGFIDFQYGELNPESRVHKSVIQKLQKQGLSKGYPKSLETLKDKDKEKDKNKAKAFLEKGSGEKPFKPDLEPIYARYPRKEGKSRGLTILKASIKTPADAMDADRALTNFLAHLKRSKVESEFIPHFKTWAGSWRDWLDPNAGTVDAGMRKKTTLEILEEMDRAEQDAG